MILLKNQVFWQFNESYGVYSYVYPYFVCNNIIKKDYNVGFSNYFLFNYLFYIKIIIFNIKFFNEIIQDISTTFKKDFKFLLILKVNKLLWMN